MKEACPCAFSWDGKGPSGDRNLKNRSTGNRFQHLRRHFWGHRLSVPGIQDRGVRSGRWLDWWTNFEWSIHPFFSINLQKMRKSPHKGEILGVWEEIWYPAFYCEPSTREYFECGPRWGTITRMRWRSLERRRKPNLRLLKRDMNLKKRVGKRRACLSFLIRRRPCLRWREIISIRSCLVLWIMKRGLGGILFHKLVWG